MPERREVLVRFEAELAPLSFREIVDSYSPNVERWAARFLSGHRSTADLEDIKAEVFSVLFRALLSGGTRREVGVRWGLNEAQAHEDSSEQWQFRDDAQLQAWLRSVTRNVVSNHERSWARKRALESELPADERIGSLLSKAPEQDGVADSLVVRRALERLEPNAREVVVRRYFLGQSAKQIARDLHYSEANVRSILYRTRRTLSRLLSD